ncbi:MAG: serine hydrolase [Planctomycetota bacterium]
MNRCVMTALFILFVSVSFAADLPRSTPEAQGVPSAALLSLVESLDQIDSMHSLMIVRHGHVIAEGWWTPYSAQSPHVLWSLSKSFTSTAAGLAISEGKMGLDDEMLKAFPEDAPAEPGANLKLMRVSDLLRMQTGHQQEPKRLPDQAWTKTFLNQPVPFKPGTHFLYNSMGTYMVSAMVQKATGKTVLEYLQPRLFEPLGIEKPTWELSPQGICAGGWGLAIRTEDIAKFGQLYLQKGNWNGKQLVPETWVAAATARQTSNGSNPKSDWDQGYGYQFWRCRNNAFRGDGAFGQYCVVMPDQDMVLVITSSLKNMQNPLDLVWEKILPACKPAALPPDNETNARLVTLLKNATVRPQEHTATPAKVFSKSYTFAANDRKLESVKWSGEGKDRSTKLAIRLNGVDQEIMCGRGQWVKGRGAWGVLKDQPIAASGGWTTDDTFKAKVCFYETTSTVTMTLKFSGNEVQFGTEMNVSFGPSKDVPLVGKAE